MKKRILAVVLLSITSLVPLFSQAQQWIDHQDYVSPDGTYVYHLMYDGYIASEIGFTSEDNAFLAFHIPASEGLIFTGYVSLTVYLDEETPTIELETLEIMHNVFGNKLYNDIVVYLGANSEDRRTFFVIMKLLALTKEVYFRIHTVSPNISLMLRVDQVFSINFDRALDLYFSLQ